jgi:hypothetical protein
MAKMDSKISANFGQTVANATANVKQLPFRSTREWIATLANPPRGAIEKAAAEEISKGFESYLDTVSEYLGRRLGPALSGGGSGAPQGEPHDITRLGGFWRDHHKKPGNTEAYRAPHHALCNIRGGACWCGK